MQEKEKKNRQQTQVDSIYYKYRRRRLFSNAGGRADWKESITLGFSRRTKNQANKPTKQTNDVTLSTSRYTMDAVIFRKVGVRVELQEFECHFLTSRWRMCSISYDGFELFGERERERESGKEESESRK